MNTVCPIQLGNEVDVIELPFINEDGLQMIPAAFLNLESQIFDDEHIEQTEQSPDSDQQLIIDNSSFQVEAENVADEPKKKKGGWPKGKKRKQNTSNRKIPKAPSTGYVLFLNERRKWYKTMQPEIEFATVTKILGREWTNLDVNEKQKYLEKAEADKQRYREELHLFHNGTELQKEKDVMGNNLSSQETSADNDKNNNEESEELYCTVCDQYFVSFHNKNQHLYGKQHLQMLTEKNCRTNNDCKGNAKDTSSMESSSANCFTSSPMLHCQKSSNINQAIIDFIELTFDRNEEIKALSNRLVINKRKYDILREEAVKYQEREKELRHQLDCLITDKSSLKEQLETLRMVPSLFGVINFQH